MKEKDAFDLRYGNIGIRAVLAAVRYSTAFGSSPIPSSRGAYDLKAESNSVPCGFQLYGQKLEAGIPRHRERRSPCRL